MREKAKLIFFITIGLYVLVIFSMPYVFVYITYAAFPVIAILGVIGFATYDESIREKMKWLFLIIFGLWVMTIITVTYVGVYLSWIVVPILIILGIMWKLTKPKET